MDIPEINGGKNTEIKITPVNHNVNADVNPAGLPSEQVNEEIIPGIQEPAPDSIPDTPGQPSDINQDPMPMEESDEDYIKKFQQDYRNVVYYEIIPSIAKYEDERKKRLLISIVGAVIISIIGVYILFHVHGRAGGDLAGLCFAGAFAFWHMIKKKFEDKVKEEIMPTIMNAIPGFTWQNTPAVTQEAISACKIFPHDDVSEKYFDDAFKGSYRGVEILMSECNYETRSRNSSHTVFRGVVIRLEMNKNFNGLTIVRPKSVCGDLFDNSDMKKFEKVELEDPEFMKKFNVFSTDQVEARYLLTTTFMERLKSMETAFESQGTFCAFFYKYIYLAPYCSEDLFNLCSLVKPVTNSVQFDTLFEEFASILRFVDHFKLDKKLGL